MLGCLWLARYGCTYALSTFWPLMRAHLTTQNVWQRDQLLVALTAAEVILVLLVLSLGFAIGVKLTGSFIALGIGLAMLGVIISAG